MSFHNILFPADGSARSAAAVPFVRAFAEKYGASVTLTRVIEIPAVWYGAAEVPVAPALDLTHLTEDAELKLTFFAADGFPGIRTQIRVEQGDPGECITDLARHCHADLIMMPTRGHGRFRAALLGSVAAKVLHDATCPVWTDAHTADGHTASPQCRRVVCSVETSPDTSPEAVRLLRFAAEFAAAHDADITLVHAVPAPAAVEERYIGRDFDVYLKDSARTAIEALQKEAGTSFRVCLGAGSVAAVVAAALDHQADLVIAGRGHLPDFAGGLRTSLYSIIRDVTCPVLSV